MDRDFCNGVIVVFALQLHPRESSVEGLRANPSGLIHALVSFLICCSTCLPLAPQKVPLGDFARLLEVSLDRGRRAVMPSTVRHVPEDFARLKLSSLFVTSRTTNILRDM